MWTLWSGKLERRQESDEGCRVCALLAQDDVQVLADVASHAGRALGMLVIDDFQTVSGYSCVSVSVG
jgi:hypothetical protein